MVLTVVRDILVVLVAMPWTTEELELLILTQGTGFATVCTGRGEGDTDRTTLRVILVVLLVTPGFKVFTALMLPTAGTSTTLLEMTPLTGDLTDTTRHGEGDLDLVVVFEDTAKVALVLELTEELATVLEATGLIRHGDGEGVLTT